MIGAAGNTVWERVFKREIIQKYNIRFISRDTVYAEDIMFILQYMMYVKKISVLSDVFYNYRVRNGSLTDNIDKSSALLCLNTLAVTGYKDAESLNMNYFCEEYYKLYFALFDNQISYLFGGQSVITTHRMLKKLNVNFLHRKWSKQIKLMILKDKKLFWSLLRKHIRRRIITLGLK